MENEVLNKLETLSNKVDTLNKEVENKASVRKDGVRERVPFARRGEDIMSSRGFRFTKFFGAFGYNGNILPEDAKIELDFANRYTKHLCSHGYQPSSNKSIMIPIIPDFFPEDLIDNDQYREMKGLMTEGMDNIDPQEVNAWYAKKSAVSPALSWVDQSVGGSYVPPAMFGPPIELLRNHEVLMNCGATVVPLGPSGRIVFPRLTAATTGAFSAENVQSTPNQPGTGQLELSAKKVMSTVVFPGELLRFGSPAVEAIVRNDMFKTVSLVADQSYLEGPGSNNKILGLATMGAAGGYGVNVVTPANANQLAGQDAYEFISTIEEHNGKPTNFIMRPKMKWAFYKSRWTPYSGGTSQGGFLFELIRNAGDTYDAVLAGLRIVDSVQVSNTRGNGSQSYVLCVNGPDIYIGLFGAIEFSQTDQGWNLLSSDQVAVRAILTTDMGVRHTGQVSFCDSLNFTIAG